MIAEMGKLRPGNSVMCPRQEPALQLSREVEARWGQVAGTQGADRACAAPQAARGRVRSTPTQLEASLEPHTGLQSVRFTELDPSGEGPAVPPTAGALPRGPGEL